MWKSFAAYEKGNGTDVGRLSRLVPDLDAAIDALPGQGERVERLRSVWLELEIIYALMLDAGRVALSEGERAEVGGLINELRSVLAASAGL